MANWDREHLSSLGINVKLPLKKGFGRTQRIDNWWTEPVWMASALTLALVYTALRVLVWDGGIHYDDHRVTSPIFSPDVLHMLHISNHPGWMNSAMLILWIPFGFRGTCYYMRRVYHRTFFQNPTGCMIAKPELNYSVGYKGEKGLFILNNIHRYMLYLAIIILTVKFYDVEHYCDRNDCSLEDFLESLENELEIGRMIKKSSQMMKTYGYTYNMVNGHLKIMVLLELLVCDGDLSKYIPE